MSCKGHFLLIAYLTVAAFSKAQSPVENISAGFYGRTEQNIYRYYGSQGVGNFNTIHVSNGYSAGFMLHSSINYLFSAGASVGLSEATYRPDIERNGSVLWSAQLRLWQIDFWGELKLSLSEKHRPVLMFGGQWMTVDYKRELYSKQGDADIYSWPQTRFMPKVGVGYYWEIGKKWAITPYAGLRLAFHNRIGYDYVFNQFYAGVNLTYQLKHW